MKIAVIGAGVVGVATAYELAVDGHEVTVYERRSAVAEEGSFANAGVIAPSFVAPWSGPGITRVLLNHWLRRPSNLHLELPLTSHQWAWLRQASRSDKSHEWLSNRSRMQRLAFYSRDRLDFLTESLALEFEASKGLLVLNRTEKEHKRAQSEIHQWRDAGIAASDVSAEEARRLEPALNAETPLQGAIYLPNDGVANCRQFALLLKRQAQLLGVNFEFNTTVARLNPARVATLLIANEGLTGMSNRVFDRVVLCAGVGAATLLKALGLAIPMTNVYGYSVSARIGEAMNAPRSAVIDTRHQIAISRLGQRVRVSGAAEFGGDAKVQRSASLHELYKVLQDWFPGAAQFAGSDARAGRRLGAGVQEWKGAYPVMPDGPPLLGDSGLPGLWLNVGHGAAGWALACGSARVLADLMAGQPAQIDIEGFGINRPR